MWSAFWTLMAVAFSFAGWYNAIEGNTIIFVINMLTVFFSGCNVMLFSID